MDAGRLGVTTYLVPPLVILLGWLLLGEVPPVLALVGGAVCLAGVALTRRRSRRPRPPVPVAAEAGPAV
jgi:drug/metabolite transporter (DMT)-like permease